ncbi:MAG: hypothetical protein HY308_09360 [Gammaproteobacteria bacterium]|nr:hypothetical protein [Gammaproteobacteria bacterium]
MNGNSNLKKLLHRLSRAIATATVLFVAASPPPVAANDVAPAADRIQPYPKNPRYWQYQGKPVVLIGGSKQHNLFQIPDLEAHLQLLASVGGNYIRNSMSSREDGNVQPFAKLANGRYDLERWNPEYWRRFEQLLKVTQQLGIIVQIEVWDRFDYSRQQWDVQPFNPKNNVNYTYAQSGFAQAYPDHPGDDKQPFFFTTPKQRHNTVVLRYQQRLVDEMLRRSLRYPNVIYCMDNETSADEAWGAYWADHIHQRAQEAGVRAFATEMWDDWNLQGPHHRYTLDHPEHYDFVELSQNNHQNGDSHWNNFHWARDYIAATPRPINNVKTYGADNDQNTTIHYRFKRWLLRLIGRAPTMNTSSDYGTTQDGTERWWRHLIGGAAAVRFHRPTAGIGLNDDAQHHIRSARLFLNEFDMTRSTPDAKYALLSDRSNNEAYATQIEGEAYAVYFPDGGDVKLAVSPTQTFHVKWLEISTSRWTDGADVNGSSAVRLNVPGDGQWLALVKKKRSN